MLLLFTQGLTTKNGGSKTAIQKLSHHVFSLLPLYSW
nr:MAG TPA: hypothetical protein [Caudoviricetes sp.]